MTVEYKMTVEDRKAKEEELMSLKAQRDLLYKNRAVALSYGIDGENFSNNEVIAIDQEIDLIMRQISSLEFEISNASIIEVAKPSDIPSVGYGCKVLLAIDYGDEKEELKLKVINSINGKFKDDEYCICSPNSPLFAEISGKHIGDKGVFENSSRGYNVKYSYEILNIEYINGWYLITSNQKARQ